MKELIRDEISFNLDENYDYLKSLLKNNSDIVYRKFNIGKEKAFLIYIDGMADKILLDDYVMESLMLHSERIKSVEDIKNELLTVTDVKNLKKLSEAIKAMLSGETLMFVNNMDTCFMIATRTWQARSISEPSGESVIRGSREGFVETIRFNTALVRRRIRDTRFRLEMSGVGTRSKTDIAIMYIEDIVNEDVLSQVKERIGKINIDAILDSGYIEQMIEDNKWSIFPQVQSTERPDVVAAALYEGRVAILIDNSPFCIIDPATLPMLFQTPDDYYQRWIYSSIMRLIRLAAIISSLLLPALYVAITEFHTSIIPTRIVYALAATREGIPFPAYIEAIVMEISIAFLVEAVIRLPKALGATIGIVGGLIIGQAAVTAGIVSPVMIIIVSVTTITTFMTPNYEAVASLRVVRFSLIIAASIIGLYGITIMLIIYLIHLIKLNSFGVPYLAPVVNANKDDMKDTFVRVPFQFYKKRPQCNETKDDIRQ